MSRCKACDRKMTDLEMCRKSISPVTGKIEYAEICTNCMQPEDEWVDFCKQKKQEAEDDDFSYLTS